MRVKLAQVLIRDRQRPVAALRVLEEIPAGLAPRGSRIGPAEARAQSQTDA